MGDLFSSRRPGYGLEEKVTVLAEIFFQLFHLSVLVCISEEPIKRKLSWQFIHLFVFMSFIIWRDLEGYFSCFFCQNDYWIM